jgi:MOSC domain-containing protein YiiM
MKMNVSGIYVGKVGLMPGDSRSTAIFKQPVVGAVDVGPLGLAGDEQADRRVHGGPDKAVHHFPSEHYPRLARRFPELAERFVAGAIGENISTAGATEADVCIGDVFALGGARVQLSQPRSPCWKIDARFQGEGITRYIAEAGIAGWYYRVLSPGRVAVGDPFELIERAAAPVSLQHFWQIVDGHPPQIEALQRLVAQPALAEGWRGKLARRIDRLRQNGAG